MRWRIGSTVFLGVLAVMLSASSGIQAQGAPQMYSTITIEVKPGMNAQFEEFIGKLKAAAEQTNSTFRWLASQSVSGSPVYTFSRPYGSFAALGEAAPDLVKVYGAAESARLLGLLQASAANESTTIYVARPDLSRPPPAAAAGAAAAAPVAVLFIDLAVRPGKEQSFEEYTKKLIAAVSAKSPNQYWQMRQRTFGPGNTAGYRVVVTFQKWADLDTPPKPMQQTMVEQYGAAEAARLEAVSNDAVQGVTQRLNRVRADLGRPPP
jgi:hypothetical protein